MYERFFRLTENPFRLTPDPRFLYFTPKHRETLSALVYGILARKGFLMVTGEAGTGKTTLIHTLLGMLTERKVSCAFVFHPLLEPTDFLEHVLVDLGVTPPSRNKGEMLRTLHGFLLRRHHEGGITALIVDEAHKLSPALLEEIRLFSNLETSTDKLLQIVLAGQSELDDLFRQEDLRQLKQRVSIRGRLSSLTLAQTAEYLAHRLGICGRTAGELFPPETVPLLYKLSRGIPRLINSIADNALLLSYAQQAQCVTIATLREVSFDLDLGEVHLTPRPGNDALPADDLAAPEPVRAPVAEPAARQAAAAHAPAAAKAAPAKKNGSGAPQNREWDSLRGLESYGERKGAMNVLSRWADMFRK
jgi:type II secretory pathway predicted ATPase ExeA